MTAFIIAGRINAVSSPLLHPLSFTDKIGVIDEVQRFERGAKKRRGDWS
jgi:hypothetical protein